MYIPMPFPRCPQCGKIGGSGFHRKCGGELEINPDTEDVYCPTCPPTCPRNWNVWRSKYYCRCGNVFDASDVVEAVAEMLMICKICMNDILERQQAIQRREKLVESSVRGFVNGVFEKIGFAVGVAVETVIRAILKFIF